MQVWTSVAERGRQLLRLSPDGAARRIDFLAADLLSERGEATNTARAEAIIRLYEKLGKEQRDGFHRYLAQNFLPDTECLKAAAEAYLAEPSAETARQLALVSESPRLELIRRLNVAPGATAALVRMREELLAHKEEQALLLPLEQDLRHLLASWFNRGFLELRRIDWNTSAAILEKLIAYEAVHEIRGWDDLRRRLAPDRRCFAFFHPALPGEPLIFVEVALVQGLAAAMPPLLARETDEEAARAQAACADTAIFYSISNCQGGLRGVAFGNFLIKQVVEELKAEFPQLKRFSTLSPVPGFRRWLGQRLANGSDPDAALLPQLESDGWWNDPAQREKLRAPLLRLCARYLTRQPSIRIDPVARFHLGNGARLERINWLGNNAPRGIQESFGITVNYLYDHDSIEDNHEAFVRDRTIVRSPDVDALLETRTKLAER